jgi:type IX secretion system PorP/SprF family membrane protein
MKKITILALLLGFTLIVKGQQDAQYSQYMFNGIYINPAYAGYKEELNLHSFYRNQWTGIKGSPKSMSIAVDGIANEGNVGLALQVASDKLGAQSSISAYGNYAYRIRVGNSESSRLALGLGFGVVQNGIDGDKLNAIDAGDQRIPLGMQSSILPDARTGVYYSNDRWYAGFSADNLIAQYVVKKSSELAYYPTQKAHYYLTAGLLLPINQTVQIKPSFLLKDDRGGPTSLDVNAFFLFADKIWIGGSYRTAVKLYDKSYLQKDLEMRNSLVATTEIYATPQLRFGYAFDYTLSKLSGYSGGSHEISVAFFIRPKSVRMLSPRYF